MKKKIFIGVLLMPAFLIGCQDNTVDNPKLKMLLGTWELVGWYDIVERDINEDGHASTDLFSQWEGCKKYSQFVIHRPPKAEIIYSQHAEEVGCRSAGTIESTSPWEFVDGTTINFLEGDYNIPHFIVKLTQDSLVLRRSSYWVCCDPFINFQHDGNLVFVRN